MESFPLPRFIPVLGRKTTKSGGESPDRHPAAVAVETPRRRARGWRAAHAPGRGRACPGAASPRHRSRGGHFVRAPAAPRSCALGPAHRRPGHVARGQAPAKNKASFPLAAGLAAARPRCLIGQAAASGGADWPPGEGARREGGAASSDGGAGGAGRATGGRARRRGRAVPRAHHRSLVLHHLGRRHLVRERLCGGDLPGLQERRPERGSLR